MDNTKKKTSGTDAKGQAEQLLLEHKEALVIYLDPDDGPMGESNISVFAKLANKSVLSSVLQEILRSLDKSHEQGSYQNNCIPAGSKA